MSKILDELEELIPKARKDGNKVALRTYQLMKKDLFEAKTAKGTKPLDDAGEVKILQRMVKQRKDAADEFKEANRPELATDELEEVEIIKQFLPEEITSEQIEAVILNCGIDLVKSNKGSLIGIVKKTYPTAEGRLVASIVDSHLS